MSASIQTHQLTKYYGRSKVAALDGLTLGVNAGEVYGFLGANGAGKSTTIRLLLNFLRPSSGSASIMGLDTARDSVAVKQHIGYLAGDVALYTKPSGREILDYLSNLQAAQGYRQVLEKRFQADLDKPVGELSKGNRQKIGIIQAFMHQPDVLILDEPTSGLDPLMQEAFYDTVLESKQRGAAILMSSHNLDEAQRICDRIGIIKSGKLITEQTLSGNLALAGPTFKVTFVQAADAAKAKKEKALVQISKVDAATVLLRPASSIADALKALSRYNIQAISTQTNDLESEFLDFYGDRS